MAKIISTVNNKGGVAKTTTTNVFATLLAFAGKKVLLVDCDESGNLSMSYNRYVEDTPAIIDGIENPKEPNITELFKYRFRTKEDVQKVIYPTYNPNIDIIPASKRHKHTPTTITKNTGNNNIILKRALQAVKNDYDYILIDNAPVETILTVNSMFASDYVLTPIRVENYSYQGLRETLASVNYIIEEHELESLTFLGTFFVQANPRTKNFKELFSEKSEVFSAAGLEDKFFKSYIRMDDKINVINSKFISLLDFPTSNALIDYTKLLLETGILDNEAKEILEAAIS